VILGDGPTAFTDARQFEPCGIDPLSRKLVVVKEGYLFPGLIRIAPVYHVLTPGAGDMRIEQLNYTRRRKPAFPSSRTLLSTRNPLRLEHESTKGNSEPTGKPRCSIWLCPPSLNRSSRREEALTFERNIK